MKHLGDITKIRGADVPPVNVIIGGSPCQDLSVAGKRAGLDGERSGLFMDQLRIIKEMRLEDETNRGRTGYGIRPRYMVWENVPGAFSSNKGADFGAVLQETARVVVQKAPAVPVPKKGWPTAGCIYGVGDGGGFFSIAWRVFDAQFWGVPQRRRRIALVADFGGLTAPEILFERESVPGDFEESGETRQGTPADAERGAIRDDSVPGGAAGFNGWKSVTGSIQYKEECAPTIEANMPPNVVVAVDVRNGALSDNMTTLQAKVGRSLNAGGVITQPTYCIQGNCIDRADTAGCNGKGWTEDVSYTLNTIDRPAVVYAVENHPNDSRVKISDDGIAQTLSGRMGTGGGNTPMVLECFAMNGFRGDYKESDIALRRLTPLECERLQGYPDLWTDIGAWDDTGGKTHKESTDSARYKALGNSIALPPWFYVLQRLSLCCRGDWTMASLFDGIGGFPLIWETLNGEGTCLWASEIEEFPIAVTKERIRE